MKFKLLEKATHADTSGIHVLLDAGTIIGDETDYPIRKGIDKARTALLQARADKAAKARGEKPVSVEPVTWFIPGHHMEPLDDEARKLLSSVPDELTLEDMPVGFEAPAPGTERKAVGF